MGGLSSTIRTMLGMAVPAGEDWPSPQSSYGAMDRVKLPKPRDEKARLQDKMERLCAKDPTLRTFAEELHTIESLTLDQLRKLHNLFLEPMKQVNLELKAAHMADKMLSLSIMGLGTLVPMLHMLGASQHVSVAVSALIPVLQGVNMNLQPNAKVQQLEKVKALCISECHHFLTLTGDYHDEEAGSSGHEHGDEELRHFLEAVEKHRSAGAKGDKKKKKKKGDKKEKK